MSSANSTSNRIGGIDPMQACSSVGSRVKRPAVRARIVALTALCSSVVAACDKQQAPEPPPTTAFYEGLPEDVAKVTPRTAKAALGPVTLEPGDDVGASWRATLNAFRCYRAYVHWPKATGVQLLWRTASGAKLRTTERRGALLAAGMAHPVCTESPVDAVIEVSAASARESGTLWLVETGG